MAKIGAPTALTLLLVASGGLIRLAAAQNARPGPLQVFILAGQSNMEGHGRIEGPAGAADKGTLKLMVTDPALAQRYQGIAGADGAWTVRDDVWIWVQAGERHGRLTVGYGAREELFGPELGFGLVVGRELDSQVLLIKTAWGGKSLGKDFRPPSAGGETGPYFEQMIACVRAVLEHLETYFPAYDGRGYEIAGFGWHQGWNDGCDARMVAEYERNMACFIRDVREELGVEDLPFVIANSGFGGWSQRNARRLGIINAQLAVARREEFAGTVRTVETRSFWRPRAQSPSGQGYHWFHNAETHYLIGAAMGRAMVALLADRAALPIADFEGQDYGDWRATGEAFGSAPARGTLPGQMRVSGFQGKGLVNTFLRGDASTGTLTSPEFAIERRHINFLIGGGGYAGQTCINLLVGGEVVRTATGPNTRPGGSERLDWATWDVADLIGRRAAIQIIDRRTGSWGHINIDQIQQGDRRREPEPSELERTLTLGEKFLLLPIENGARKRRMEMLIDGRVTRAFDIELAMEEPDWWAFMDISAFRGQRATLQVDSLERGSHALAAIHQADRIEGRERLYDEALRPQFHFSQRRGWNNDPNGLVYYDGEYHLFFQHNPYGTRWANMHWGHAVSGDLVHWSELPIALYPWVQARAHCFSGSAVVDANNTAGFQTGAEKALVAVFTDTGCGEAIAYSNDRGRTFTYYDKNPVIRHRGRDPKVIWYEPGQHWVMAVYDEDEKLGRNIAIYNSTNLRDWVVQSHIPGYFECPEIFELAVDGDPENTRWVVYAADAKYAIGAFDGKTFTPEHEGKHQVHWGSYYASQTFNQTPDGRRIQIGWARIDLEGMPFNQLMGFPTRLTLRTTERGVRMFAEPIAEIALLHGEKHELGRTPIGSGEVQSLAVAGRLFDIRATFALGDAERFGIAFAGERIVYDARGARLMGMPLEPTGGRIHLQILVDRPSVEVCGNHGRVFLTKAFRSSGGIRSIEAFAEGGAATLEALQVHELRSAWRVRR